MHQGSRASKEIRIPLERNERNMKKTFFPKFFTGKIVQGIGKVGLGGRLLLEAVELAVGLQDEVARPPGLDVLAWKTRVQSSNLGSLD